MDQVSFWVLKRCYKPTQLEIEFHSMFQPASCVYHLLFNKFVEDEGSLTRVTWHLQYMVQLPKVWYIIVGRIPESQFHDAFVKMILWNAWSQFQCKLRVKTTWQSAQNEKKELPFLVGVTMECKHIAKLLGKTPTLYEPGWTCTKKKPGTLIPAWHLMTSLSTSCQFLSTMFRCSCVSCHSLWPWFTLGKLEKHPAEYINLQPGRCWILS